MNLEGFSDAALVVIGHGSTTNAESAAPVYQHASEIRRRKCFAEVREAFWKQDPQVVEVVSKINQPRVFLAPLFISEGYFSEQTIPKALGFDPQPAGPWTRVRQTAEGILFYCHPVGTHESMTEVLLARAADIVERFPFPIKPDAKESTLFIAGHGTEQNENSRKAIERQEELIRGRNIYAAVHGVFLEEEPRVEDCYKMAKTRNVIVVPFFISDGMHSREDIPVMLGAPPQLVKQRLAAGQPTWRNPSEKHGKLVWYTSSVGTEPKIADVILERACEAAGWQLQP